MITLNFIVNTLLLIIAGIAVIGIMCGEDTAVVFLLYLQIIIGAIQYFGSTVMLFIKRVRTDGIVKHWLFSTGFLLMLGMSAFGGDGIGALMFVLLITVPWILAFYYWRLTYLLYKNRYRL